MRQLRQGDDFYQAAAGAEGGGQAVGLAVEGEGEPPGGVEAVLS